MLGPSLSKTPADNAAARLQRQARWVVTALLLSWWGAPAVAAAELPGAPAVTAIAGQASATAAPPTPATGAARYAEREVTAQLEQWTGGDGGIYIGSGVLVIALLVALFLLILR
jgi:hypothetical protein